MVVCVCVSSSSSSTSSSCLQLQLQIQQASTPFQSHYYYYPYISPLTITTTTTTTTTHQALYITKTNTTRTRSRSSIVNLSTHSNQKLIKPNRKSKHGHLISTYDDTSDDYDYDDDDDDDDEDEEEEDDDDVFGYVAGTDWLINDEFAETEGVEVNGEKIKSKKKKRTNARLGRKTQVEKDLNGTTLDTGRNLPVSRDQTLIPNGKRTREKSNLRSTNRSFNSTKTATRKSADDRYSRLSETLDIDEKWIPLLDYLRTYGLKDSDFIQMYQRHTPSLQINVCSAEERLEYLVSIGIKHAGIRRILLRQPQCLEYTVQNSLKPHVSFLIGLGIPSSRIAQILVTAPSIFSYSVENSLKPTVRYLVEEVGINKKNLAKVIQLSPQILVQRIDISWNTRYMFLSKELGAPKDSIVKMVTKHPQLLHYSIDDGLLPRINFLRSIGMRDSDVLKVLTSLTQVLSLSLEGNLKPKYKYLVNELNNEVQSLTKYPMYLSLSLDQRIRPRHKFLVSLNKAPKGPFPLSSLVPTDECFCRQWADTSVDKYLEFRQRLLLTDLAKKYEK